MEVVSLSKIRVYKLADKLNMESKELINILNKLGVEVSSHMSTVEDETAELVEDMVKDKNKSEAKTEKEDKSEISDEKQQVEEKEIEEKPEIEEESEETEESDEDLEPVTEGITIRELSEKLDFPA